MRTLILAALLALAVAPAALAVDEGPSPVHLAKAACKSEKAQMGTRTNYDDARTGGGRSAS